MTVTDDWSVLDDLLGVEAEPDIVTGVGDLAFYGRCSTEDNQDPETSLGWQSGNASKLVEPLGGRIVANYFDVGQSRSVPWERREQASQLLRDLRNPNRGWSGIVLGEGTRCFFGNQFSLTAPKLAHAKVQLWVPELGGVYDPLNASHKMLMSVLGGMSESERQHVQARVRAAMDAQVLSEGRFQGGRAPYGYKVVDGGEHPNPRKAQEGYRLRIMVLDDFAAAIVERIFELYLAGLGDRAIARRLNADGVPCPSAHTPRQNRHRLADGWQSSTVKAILDNPRYTGYAFFGRWERTEMLLDPEDVAAGVVTRFRRADQSRIVRSRRPAHPAIVSVETFTQAALRRRSRAAGGRRGQSKLERSGRPTTKVYPMKGHLRCTICGRKFESAPRKHAMYYRCPSRTLAPGSPALASHPPTVYLPESAVMEPLNEWIAQVFSPEYRQETIAQLLDAGEDTSASVRTQQAEARASEAQTKIRRYTASIEAGVDPTILVDALNAAQAELSAARAELANLPQVVTLDAEAIATMVDQLGAMAAALNAAEPQDLADLYEALRLDLKYDAEQDLIEVTARPTLRVNSARVRGGT
ncbi:recombinase family protein [Kribbella sindirgiensis]|uniref:Recombinase family protein n=1 Tax=Kribbella sindirgiensis TaxID=1124744 RepID=A0A4R0I643_9ACTN|nr:recombinase family protein [Kribbella sindirgiensis]TCC19925.1 recombinase family protein [Kribbella sindirgiensis]